MRHWFLIAAVSVAIAFAVVPVSRADDAKPAADPTASLIPPDQGPTGPASAPTGKPWPAPSQAQFDEGKHLFQNRCARCHGWNMVNLGSISFDLREFPRDDSVRFFHSVRYGKNAMPVWHDILSTDDIAAIWAYVRTGGKM